MLISMKKSLCISVLLFFIATSAYSGTGSSIISEAEKYRDKEWTCNIQNVRWENSDNDAATNNYVYPFWPEGQPYREEGSTVDLTSTGQHTGIPYAFGLRDTTGIFEYKLTESAANDNENNYLAGNIGKRFWLLPPPLIKGDRGGFEWQ